MAPPLSNSAATTQRLIIFGETRVAATAARGSVWRRRWGRQRGCDETRIDARYAASSAPAHGEASGGLRARGTVTLGAFRDV